MGNGYCSLPLALYMVNLTCVKLTTREFNWMEIKFFFESKSYVYVSGFRLRNLYGFHDKSVPVVSCLCDGGVIVLIELCNQFFCIFCIMGHRVCNYHIFYIVLETKIMSSQSGLLKIWTYKL